MSDNCEFHVSGYRHSHFRWIHEGERFIARIDVPGCGQDSDIYVTPTRSRVEYRVTAPEDDFGVGTTYYGHVAYPLKFYENEAPQYYISSGILHFYAPKEAGGVTIFKYKTTFRGTKASNSYTEVHSTEDEDSVVYKIAVPGVPDGTIPGIEISDEAVVFGVSEPVERNFNVKISLDRDHYWLDFYECRICNGVLRIVIPKKP